MLVLKALIKKFDDKGEKTGWTYVQIPRSAAAKIKPGNKKSFLVKGFIDDYAFEGLSLLPMGEGDFILALNASIRKAIHKQKGATVNLKLENDEKGYQLNPDLVACLSDDVKANAVFKDLPNSHKNYYSKWVDSAKTAETKARRIAVVLRGLADGLDFGGMLRREREEKAFFK
ncbi:MAG: YdeI/OmpD-associated family protein [Bacteroidota bacterium]